MTVTVTVNANGGPSERILALPEWRAIVTSNVPREWTALYRTRADWEAAASVPRDDMREYDSAAEAFTDVVQRGR